MEAIAAPPTLNPTPHPVHSPHSLLALLLPASLAAQTFLVDIHNGPGTQFTTIDAAIAAVPNGATLLIRPGDYPGFTILQKSLTLLADPGATASPSIAVTGLGASQQVVIRGLAWGNPAGVATFSVQSCSGSVILDNCSSTPAVAQLGGTLSIVASDRVHLVNSLLVGVFIEPLYASGSDVTITDSTLRNLGARHGLLVIGGRTRISGSYIEGSGAITAQSARSVVEILGNGRIEIGGNSALSASSTFVDFAIDGTGAAVVDPNTTLLTFAGALAGPGVASSAPLMASCTAATDGLGGTATATLTGPVGSLGALLCGFTGPAINLPGISFANWIAPGTQTSMTVGNAPLTNSYLVPTAPWVRGIAICWQGVTLDPTQGLQLSNPSHYVHW